jgi:hypothetical protein
MRSPDVLLAKTASAGAYLSTSASRACFTSYFSRAASWMNWTSFTASSRFTVYFARLRAMFILSAVRIPLPTRYSKFPRTRAVFNASSLMS